MRKDGIVHNIWSQLHEAWYFTHKCHLLLFANEPCALYRSLVKNVIYSEISMEHEVFAVVYLAQRHSEKYMSIHEQS